MLLAKQQRSVCPAGVVQGGVPRCVSVSLPTCLALPSTRTQTSSQHTLPATIHSTLNLVCAHMQRVPKQTNKAETCAHRSMSGSSRVACVHLRGGSLSLLLSWSSGGSCTSLCSGSTGPAGSWGGPTSSGTPESRGCPTGSTRRPGRTSVSLSYVSPSEDSTILRHIVSENLVCPGLAAGSRSSSCWSIWVTPWSASSCTTVTACPQNCVLHVARSAMACPTSSRSWPVTNGSSYADVGGL